MAYQLTLHLFLYQNLHRVMVEGIGKKEIKRLEEALLMIMRVDFTVQIWNIRAKAVFVFNFRG